MTANNLLIDWIKDIRTRFLDLDKIYITIFPNIVQIYFDRGEPMISSLHSSASKDAEHKLEHGDFSSMLSGNNKIEAFLFFKNPKQEEASYKFLEGLGRND